MAFFKGSNCNNIPLFFAWGYFGSLLAQCFHQLKRDWLKTVPVAKTSQRSSETGFMTRKQVWLYSVNNDLLPRQPETAATNANCTNRQYMGAQYKGYRHHYYI